MRILHLILKKDPYDRILAGTKTVEYRDRTKYWKIRLDGKEFDAIQFRNGYRKDARQMILEWNGMNISDQYYGIKLGKFL